MRTLYQLLKAETTAQPPVILVSADEARLLADNGAAISNGMRMHSDGEGGDLTQTYRLADKKFKWVETAHDKTPPVQ